MAKSIRLHELVETSKAVRATPGKLEKRARMAELFSRLEANDLRLAASYLAGEIPQGALHVGWSALQQAVSRPSRPESDLPLFRDMPPASDGEPVAQPARSPGLSEIDATFERLKAASGPGSASLRAALLADLVRRTSADERAFLSGLLMGELRQGALRALVVEAVAQALGVPLEGLRRAIMFAGSFAEVVHAVARDGAPALERFGLRPLVPVEPMLAAQAAGLEDALSDLGTAAVEWKLDGVRVQMHRSGDDVRVFSRQLRDVTSLVPELAVLGRSLQCTSAILDGEAIALGSGDRPVPFQDLMSAFSREREVEPAARPALQALFFDVLHLDGDTLVDRPYRDRRAILEKLLPSSRIVPQSVAATVEEAQAVYDAALAAGHEGVLVKDLEAPYTAGRRGAAWRKVKPAVTFDLVILAAEWGHGRRRGLLSNLHLGARVPEEPGRFLMLGKTFKGLTDAMLRDLTADLLGIAARREPGVVHVRPLRVVEIAFDKLQRSPRYDSGLALRFARVKRFRPDKGPDAATTIEEVRRVHAQQGGANVSRRSA